MSISQLTHVTHNLLHRNLVCFHRKIFAKRILEPSRPGKLKCKLDERPLKHEVKWFAYITANMLATLRILSKNKVSVIRYNKVSNVLGGYI